MPTPKDIALFRYGIKEELLSVTGYLYFCNEQLNTLLKEKEGILASTPTVYCILMNKKGVGVDDQQNTSTQRNVYFRYDLSNTIFFMGFTGNSEIKDGKVLAFEYEVYFFPQATFLTIEDDYIALEKWLAGENSPTIKARTAINDLMKFINDNDGKPFSLTKDHTPKLRGR